MATSQAIPHGTPAGEVLARSRELVDPALRAAVGTLPGPVRRIAGYHLGWWDEHDRRIDADSGKAIRPALVLLSAEAVGGAPAKAVPAAVATELVHNFSLLHDDVMDGDTTRRHRPTAWSVFGLGAAILTGDALLSLAFDVLAAAGAPADRGGARMLSAAVCALIDGQCADLAFENRTDVNLVECLRMAGAKTGALIGCASGLGALLGGAGPERTAQLRAFGEALGLAFQLVDDMLGIWGDQAVTGKPVCSDLRQRKKSLPVVAALTSDTPAGRELAALYLCDEPLTSTELARAADLIDAAGGRSWCQERTDALLAAALAHLRSAGAAPRPAAELDALARLVVGRDR